MIKSVLSIIGSICIISSIPTISIGQENNLINNEIDFYKPFIDIGIPLITIATGAISAKYIVGKWQQKKEISDLRNKILDNYTDSFKKHVILLDTFIARLVLNFLKFESKEGENKILISELLPWGYTFNDFMHYSTKVPTNSVLKDFRNIEYDKDKIKKNFEELEEANQTCYFVFNHKSLEKFNAENEQDFKNNFYGSRNKITEFQAKLAQDYNNNPELVDEFNAMWEYMMGCYMYINKIITSNNEQEFTNQLKNYNHFAEFLFDMLLSFEQKLIASDITI